MNTRKTVLKIVVLLLSVSLTVFGACFTVFASEKTEAEEEIVCGRKYFYANLYACDLNSGAMGPVRLKITGADLDYSDECEGE